MARRLPLNEDRDGALDPAFDQIVGGAVGDPVEGTGIAESPDWSGQMAEAALMGILTSMDAAVLTAAFSLGEGGRSWRELGRRVGCSHQRAQRAFLHAIHKWHSDCQLTDRLVEHTEVLVVQIRGQRQREVWQQRIRQLGTRRTTQRELITEGEQYEGALAASDGASGHAYWPLPTSPMRELLYALAIRLSTQPDASDAVCDASDWGHNLRWAERKIRRARRSNDAIVTFREILRALARGCHLCENCHTPILAGCWIDERRINRARRFCGPSCKMQWRRRQSNRRVDGVAPSAQSDVVARS